MLPIHVHFISFWNLCVPLPRIVGSFKTLFPSYHTSSSWFYYAPCSLGYIPESIPFIPRAKSHLHRRIMVGFLPHFDSLHTYFPNILWLFLPFYETWKKTITTIIYFPKIFWNNIHHNMYIYLYLIIHIHIHLEILNSFPTTILTKTHHLERRPRWGHPTSSKFCVLKDCTETWNKGNIWGENLSKIWGSIGQRNTDVGNMFYSLWISMDFPHLC